MQHNILNIWLSSGGNMTPCIYELLQPVYFIPSRRIFPAADLLPAVSPKAVAYLLVPPPQSLAQIAALHPQYFGLVILPNGVPVYGFYAARLPHRRLQSL